MSEGLKSLKAAAKAREKASEQYLEAMKQCVAEGLTNVAMARAVGVSETAIRLYKSRKGLS